MASDCQLRLYAVSLFRCRKYYSSYLFLLTLYLQTQVKSRPALHPLHPTHTGRASYTRVNNHTCRHPLSPRFTFTPRCAGYFLSQFLLSTVGCLTFPMEPVINTPVSTNNTKKVGTSWCNPGKCRTKHWCNPSESCDYSHRERGTRMPCLLSAWVLLSPLPASTKTDKTHVLPVCSFEKLWSYPPTNYSQVKALHRQCAFPLSRMGLHGQIEVHRLGHVFSIVSASCQSIKVKQ